MLRSFKTILILSLIISCNDNQFQVERDEINKGIVYEVNIRQYSKEGTFKAVTNDIKKIKELGVEILWLMPIHPIGKEKRKGGLGSYYSISDYKGINPEFGDNEDLKELVEEAHANEMIVIMDWVANHTAWDHSWIDNNPDYYTKGNDGKITDPINPYTGESWGWTDVADLNFENSDMRSEMIDAMKYWIEEFDIDGYRCDAAHSCLSSTRIAARIRNGGVLGFADEVVVQSRVRGHPQTIVAVPDDSIRTVVPVQIGGHLATAAS